MPDVWRNAQANIETGLSAALHVTNTQSHANVSHSFYHILIMATNLS